MTTNVLLYVGSGGLSSFADLHQEGGIIFMIPLTIMLAVNLGLILYGFFKVIQKKPFQQFGLDMIQQIGGLAAAWGTFSTIIALFFAFKGIEGSPEAIPLQVIAGGLSVGLITIIYGILILCLSMLASIILKLLNRRTIDG